MSPPERGEVYTHTHTLVQEALFFFFTLCLQTRTSRKPRWWAVASSELCSLFYCLQKKPKKIDSLKKATQNKQVRSAVYVQVTFLSVLVQRTTRGPGRRPQLPTEAWTKTTASLTMRARTAETTRTTPPPTPTTAVRRTSGGCRRRRGPF